MIHVVVHDLDGDPATVTVFKDIVELEAEVGESLVYLNFNHTQARELAAALLKAADEASE